jgi:ADP-heptose:LPS heptosyltransferase
MRLSVIGRGIGDEVCATGFVREVKRAFPDELIRVEMSRPELWANNPWLNWGNTEKFSGVRFEIHCERPGANYLTAYGAELGIPIIDHTPQVFLSPEDRAYEFGINFDWERLVVVDPWTAMSARRWPLDNWRAFAKTLLEEGWQVVEVGQRDRDIDERARGGIPCTKSFLRQLELRETLVLLSKAAIYVGSDSGVGHMAAAVGTPQVTLYGPVNWYDLAYWNTTPIYPLSKCCGKINTCDRLKDGVKDHCLAEVTVDRMLDTFRLAARRWVNKRPTVRPEQDRLTREQLQAVTGEAHSGW